MDTIQAILERYSHREAYEPTPVPREALKLIMETGLAAPSGCNLQTTSLIGLDDAELIGAVSKHMNRPEFASTPAAVCVLSNMVSAYEDTHFYVQDYSAVIENMLIAITAMGYASCWVEGHVTRDKEISMKMARELGVPEDYKLVAYLPIGIPVKKGEPAGKKPFEQRAWFNGFGK